MPDQSFFKRRWFEFRTGYSTYLTFAVAFSNFILLLYNFAPDIKDNIQFEHFIILIGVSILIIGIAFGMFHLKRQYPTEAMVHTEQNPYFYKIVPDSKEVVTTKAMFDQCSAIVDLIKSSKDISDELKQYHITGLQKDCEKLHKILIGDDSREFKK